MSCDSSAGISINGGLVCRFKVAYIAVGKICYIIEKERAAFEFMPRAIFCASGMEIELWERKPTHK